MPRPPSLKNHDHKSRTILFQTDSSLNIYRKGTPLQIKRRFSQYFDFPRRWGFFKGGGFGSVHFTYCIANAYAFPCFCLTWISASSIGLFCHLKYAQNFASETISKKRENKLIFLQTGRDDKSIQCKFCIKFLLAFNA